MRIKSILHFLLIFEKITLYYDIYYESRRSLFAYYSTINHALIGIIASLISFEFAAFIRKLKKFLINFANLILESLQISHKSSD